MSSSSDAFEPTLFQPTPWDEYLPYLSAGAGVLITLAWLYSFCTRDPDAARDKMRLYEQRRGVDCALALVSDGHLDRWDREWRKMLPRMTLQAFAMQCGDKWYVYN